VHVIKHEYCTSGDHQDIWISSFTEETAFSFSSLMEISSPFMQYTLILSITTVADPRIYQSMGAPQGN
jgi:hypothetical protein